MKNKYYFFCNLCLPGRKRSVSRWQCSQLSEDQRKVLLKENAFFFFFFYFSPHMGFPGETYLHKQFCPDQKSLLL